MANWQVIAAPITLFPHPDPEVERLVIGKIGMFQVVVGKDNGYTQGQIVVFAPERSVLPEDLKGEYVNTDTGVSYLGGPNADRVKSVRLKGELSEGATIPLSWVKQKLGLSDTPGSTEEIPLNVDLSKALGISKYEPPIPEEMNGIFLPMGSTEGFQHHDVEQFRLYEREFTPGEPVYATIKVHGTQISTMRHLDGTLDVSSKGGAKDFFSIKESNHNLYWKCLKHYGADEALRAFMPGHIVQAWAEGFPAQGYSYGATEPTALFYRLDIDGQKIGLQDILTKPEYAFFKEHWVPVVYDGPFDAEKLVALAKEIKMEPISGKKLHLNEGIVVEPFVPRKSREGFQLLVKILNPKYKSTGEEVS